MDPQNDDDVNIEAAEAEENFDLGDILMANSREPEEQNDEELMEADVDDPDQVDPPEAERKPENLESETMVVPDDDEDYITGVENLVDLGEKENANEVGGMNDGTEKCEKDSQSETKEPKLLQ